MFQRIIDFLKYLLYRFARDGASQNAAALTYTTLLSLVPLMTVILAIFSAFPVSERIGQQVQDFVFNNFVPASGEMVQRYLLEFSQKASSLSGLGSVFLLGVALLLMANIDRALNTIWHVKKKRRTLNKFIVYWAILSLGPILIGVSVAITSYLVSVPLFFETAETLGIRSTFLSALPMLASVLAFTLMYLVVPNRHVSMRHAFAGGLLAGILFEVAKRGFALYVAYFPTYEAIYGAMAAVPIFLIWIYVSWIVTLLGAQFTYCLETYQAGWQISHAEGKGDLLSAYSVLVRLWTAQQNGQTCSVRQLAQSIKDVSEPVVEDVLLQLAKAHIVLQAETGQWALARDMSTFTLADLYHSGSFVMPHADALDRSDYAAVVELIRKADKHLFTDMSIPLGQLFKRNKQPKMKIV